MTMTAEKFDKLFDNSEQSNAILASLRDLCAREYSLENLGFLLVVRKYKARHPGYQNAATEVHTIPGMDRYLVPAIHWGSVDTYGRWIYDTFIDPNGAATININSAIRNRLAAKLGPDPNGVIRGAFVPADFDEAYREIVRLVVNDTCKRLQVLDA